MKSVKSVILAEHQNSSKLQRVPVHLSLDVIRLFETDNNAIVDHIGLHGLHVGLLGGHREASALVIGHHQDLTLIDPLLESGVLRAFITSLLMFCLVTLPFSSHISDMTA